MERKKKKKDGKSVYIYFLAFSPCVKGPHIKSTGLWTVVSLNSMGLLVLMHFFYFFVSSSASLLVGFMVIIPQRACLCMVWISN